ncbi:hypothetical protein LCGC14_0140820 [marine sediment metagenome]|uniref:Uncharacterized protein n=1 Tax=marine sediment metagenome TaxID=412755 RepID=A0A0F9XI52_9ZZZZ
MKSKEIFTLDHEFDRWCDQLLAEKKIDSLAYLRIMHGCGPVWEACRQKCADLCMQNDQKGTAMQIMTNIDGSIDESWMKSHEDSKE